MMTILKNTSKVILNLIIHKIIKILISKINKQIFQDIYYFFYLFHFNFKLLYECSIVKINYKNYLYPLQV